MTGFEPATHTLEAVVLGRAYDAVRAIVQHLGGTMAYERAVYCYGAWVIQVGDGRLVIEAEGKRSFPPLDSL